MEASGVFFVTVAGILVICSIFLVIGIMLEPRRRDKVVHETFLVFADDESLHYEFVCSGCGFRTTEAREAGLHTLNN